jgi:hypothetical protein
LLSFVVDWGQVAKGRVTSPRVVPGFDPLEDRVGEFLPGGPVVAVEQFALQGPKNDSIMELS